MTMTETNTTDETETDAIVVVRPSDIVRNVDTTGTFYRCDDVDILDDDTADRWLSMIILDATTDYVLDVVVLTVIDMVDDIVTTIVRPRSARMVVAFR